MNSWNENNICSITVTEDVAVGQFIDFVGGIAQSKKALGVSLIEGDKGKLVSVKALGAVLVQAGGTIAAGDKVVADASGYAIKQTEEDYYEGYATEAGNKGDFIQIIRGM